MNIYTSVVMLWLCLVLSGCVSIPANPVPVITDETFGNYHEELEPELILITMTPEYHALYTELKPVPMSGELPPRYTTFLSRVESSYGLKRVANWPLPAIDIFCVVFEIKDSNDRKWMVAELAQEPDIETAQIVQSFNSQEQSYNDPYLSLQHGFHSTKTIGTHQWSRGKGTRIAVIDTGMNDTHPDLVSSSEATMNFVDNDQAMFRSDTHGTAVGGVIAAEADNLKGMVGMAPDASLLALKACWHSLEDPSKALCNTLTLAKALNFSILQEVDIINMSLTGPPDPILERLVLKALERDIIVVAAKPAHANEAFPVSIPGTITGAMPGDPSALLSAPGRHVLSTHPNGEYEFFDGSSFSTAHISGLAALLRSLSPGLAPSELLSLLESTANPETGAVDACRAVDVVRRTNDKTAIGSGCG